MDRAIIRRPKKGKRTQAREIRVCKVCGANFFATEENEFCPICMLNKALDGGVKSDESSFEETLEPAPTQRFEHYELAFDEDGQSLELGRGAMGGHLQGI